MADAADLQSLFLSTVAAVDRAGLPDGTQPQVGDLVAVTTFRRELAGLVLVGVVLSYVPERATPLGYRRSEVQVGTLWLLEATTGKKMVEGYNDDVSSDRVLCQRRSAGSGGGA